MNIDDIKNELNNIEEFHHAVIFDTNGKIILQKNSQILENETKHYLDFYNNRDDTIKKGFIFNKEYYEVHRFHPPLIYGRMCDEERKKGISLCKGKNKNNEEIYFLIIYLLPYLSARCVPMQVEFFNKYLGSVEDFKD